MFMPSVDHELRCMFYIRILKISCIEVIKNQTFYTAYFFILYNNFPTLKFITL